MSYPEGEPEIGWTKAQLEAYADDNEINLDGATTKAQILAVIYTAEKTEPVVAWTLPVVIAYADVHSVTLSDDEDLEGSVGEIHAVWELLD